MALSKKTSFNISDQLSSINQMSETGSAAEEEAQASTLKDVPAAEETPVTNYIPAATKKKAASKKTVKNENNQVMVGVKMPQAAKDQFREFFAQYGLNLSEAIKNALEVFASDIQDGTVRVTVTRHWERVEEEE